MDRRKFLKSTGLLVAGAALPVKDLASALAHNGRNMTTDDMLAIEQPQDLRLSSTGTAALFGRRRLSADRSKFETSLWMLELGQAAALPRALTRWGSDTNGAFSPDGTVIAFLRQVEGRPQLFVMPSGGGNARLFTKLERGITRFAWSPDGRSLALSGPTTVVPTPVRDADLAEGVHIFTHADYRVEGRGYVDFDRPEQIWIVAYDQAGSDVSPRQLTHGYFAAQGMSWTVNSSSLLYTCVESDEPYYDHPKPSLYQLAVATGERQLVTPMKVGNTSEISPATKLYPSPNGRRIAYVADNPKGERGFEQGDLFVLDSGGGEARSLTATFDPDIVDSGTSASLAWLDDDRILAKAQWQGATNLVVFDVATGHATPWSEGRQVVRDFVVSNAGKTILALISDPLTPTEIYDVSVPKRPLRLTQLNAPLRSKLALVMPESLWFKGPGGEQIQAFLYHPVDFDPKRTYPMVLSIHGGPYGFNSDSFNDDAQIMAGAGYLFLLVNPRGSMSYGQMFASALTNWPGGQDIDDMMAGVDFVAKRSYVNKAKLGVTGGSAGAVAVNWIIGHTNRFAAAVSNSGIADFQEMWYTSDQLNFWPKSAPFQQVDPVEMRSPIKAAANIKTPTMFIDGDRDYRTPAANGGQMMFRVLKYLKVPTAYIWFEGAGHMINTSTNPLHPAMRSRHMLRWFDHYLKGVTTPEYDVAARSS